MTTHEPRITDLEGSTKFWEETVFLWPILVNEREHLLKRDDFPSLSERPSQVLGEHRVNRRAKRISGSELGTPWQSHFQGTEDHDLKS